VIFYTDGLVERRTEIIDQGLRRLCDATPSDDALDADAVCAAIMAEMNVGAADDDIALLVMRRES
jgi:sigma-B regulation protein RsbU (phosphoserine phosphatase)